MSGGAMLTVIQNKLRSWALAGVIYQGPNISLDVNQAIAGLEGIPQAGAGAKPTERLIDRFPYRAKWPFSKKAKIWRDVAARHVIQVWLPGTTRKSAMPSNCALCTETLPSLGPENTW